MKKGDPILCVDKGRSNFLTVGVVYVVKGFLGNGFDRELICLEGVNGWFSQDSFETQ